MPVTIDHITLGADSLAGGTAYLREMLGVEAPAGGKHADMGTHNCVMRIGSGVFLELLAIDPEASALGRPRWFNMDDPAQQARIAQKPIPVGWVLSVDDLAKAQASSIVDLGPVKAMSRGSRSWKLTVPDSGRSAFDGLMPALIEWSPGPHPSEGMSFPGPVLKQLILRHPAARELGAALDAIGAGHLAQIEEDSAGPSMAFVFSLSDGATRTFS